MIRRQHRRMNRKGSIGSTFLDLFLLFFGCLFFYFFISWLLFFSVNSSNDTSNKVATQVDQQINHLQEIRLQLDAGENVAAVDIEKELRFKMARDTHTRASDIDAAGGGR
jgi:hypothetical protein